MLASHSMRDVLQVNTMHDGRCTHAVPGLLLGSRAWWCQASPLVRAPNALTSYSLTGNDRCTTAVGHGSYGGAPLQHRPPPYGTEDSGPT